MKVKCYINLYFAVSLWIEAKKYPRSHELKDACNYVVVGVTTDLRQQTFWDEDQLLSELSLHSPLVKVIQPKESYAEAKLNAQIGSVIGRPVQDLDNLSDPEISAFRSSILKTVCDAVDCRELGGFATIARYHHPPVLDPTPNLPPSLTRHLDHGYLHISIWLQEIKLCSVRVFWNETPRAVILSALEKMKLLRETQPKKNIAETVQPCSMCDTTKRKRKRLFSGFTFGSDDSNDKSKKVFGRKMTEKENDCKCSQPDVIDEVANSDIVPELLSGGDNEDLYVLKICGASEYLLAEEPITQYKVSFFPVAIHNHIIFAYYL